MLAIRDVLAAAEPSEIAEVARWLDDMLAGTAPDDLPPVRQLLLEQDEPVYGEIPMSSDDELVDHWRTGVYPYKNLMRRKTYERAEVPPAGRAAEAAGLGEGDRPAGRDPLRGP